MRGGNTPTSMLAQNTITSLCPVEPSKILENQVWKWWYQICSKWSHSASQQRQCDTHHINKTYLCYEFSVLCVVWLQGVVLKFNANQRYATTSVTAAILREVASKVGVPLQVSLLSYRFWAVFCCANSGLWLTPPYEWLPFMFEVSHERMKDFWRKRWFVCVCVFVHVCMHVRVCVWPSSLFSRVNICFGINPSDA